MKELPTDLLAACARSSMEQVFSTMLNLAAQLGPAQMRHEGLESSAE